MSFKEQLTLPQPYVIYEQEGNMYSTEATEGTTPLTMAECFAELADCEVFMLTRVDMMNTKEGDDQLNSGWRLEFVYLTAHVIEDYDILVVLNEAVRVKNLPAL